MIDIDLSSTIAKRVSATHSNCWDNAYEGLRYLPEALYVEGWVVMAKGKRVIEHGWLEYSDKIIDPTLILSHSPAELETTAYYPGARYTKSEAAKIKIERKGDLPLIWAYGWGGEDCPEYVAAFEQAAAFAGAAHKKIEPSASDLIMVGGRDLQVDGKQQIHFDHIAIDAGISGAIWYEVQADQWRWDTMDQIDAEFVINTVWGICRELSDCR